MRTREIIEASPDCHGGVIGPFLLSRSVPHHLERQVNERFDEAETRCAREQAGESAATRFTWDIYLFGSETGMDDDSRYTDVTNCMMLAGLPGGVGDGEPVSLEYIKADTTKLPVTTYVGAKATPDTLRRFLVGPADCENTGIAETLDGRAIFVNIQHAGETPPLVSLRPLPSRAARRRCAPAARCWLPP